MGDFKSFSLCQFWRSDNWLLFWQNKTPWGSSYRKKGFLTLFWWKNMISDLSSSFLRVKNGGLKVSLCPFWRFDNWLLFWQNKTPWGSLYRKKRLFQHSSDDKTWFLTSPVVFKDQNGGLKKASLYVHFEALTTNSYFGKTRPPGESSYRKKAFQHSSDEKTWFLTFPVVFKGQQWGVKKASLYVHFEGLTTVSYFGKTRPPLGGLHIEKKVFLTLFWWKNMISDLSSSFLRVKNGGLKSFSLSILKVWQLTLILAKQDPLGEFILKKRLFQHSSDEKTWFLTFPVDFRGQNGGGF